MHTPLDADAAALPHAGLAAGLRDLTLALFWSDAAAGVRGWLLRLSVRRRTLIKSRKPRPVHGPPTTVDPPCP